MSRYNQYIKQVLDYYNESDLGKFICKECGFVVRNDEKKTIEDNFTIMILHARDHNHVLDFLGWCYGFLDESMVGLSMNHVRSPNGREEYGAAHKV